VLQRLANDLAGVPSVLILANFEIPRPKNSCQIDFVVVTPTRTELVELKNLDGPVFGGENGHWTQHDRSGRPVTHSGENPWQQAKNAKLFLNDTMRNTSRKPQACQRLTRAASLSSTPAFVFTRRLIRYLGSQKGTKKPGCDLTTNLLRL
jgi:hypothetical protein